jgi:hypothetical protein
MHGNLCEKQHVIAAYDTLTSLMEIAMLSLGGGGGTQHNTKDLNGDDNKIMMTMIENNRVTITRAVCNIIKRRPH